MRKSNLAFCTTFLLIILFSNTSVANTYYNTTSLNKYLTTINNPSFSFYQDIDAKKIIFNSNNLDYTIEIFNEDGDVIKKLTIKKNTKLEISTKEFKSGEYFLRYTSNSTKNNSVKKITIK